MRKNRKDKYSDLLMKDHLPFGELISAIADKFEFVP